MGPNTGIGEGLTSMDSDGTMNPYASMRRDWEMASKPGHELSGKTSDRIRSGKIAHDWLGIGKARPGDDPPSPAAVRSAEGHGLGSGATARRSGPGAD